MLCRSPSSRRCGRGLPLDELGVYPAVPLPFLDVRLDVAGPPANFAVYVEANKFEIDVVVKTFPINNAEPPAPTRRTEAGGTRFLCHLKSPPKVIVCGLTRPGLRPVPAVVRRAISP